MKTAASVLFLLKIRWKFSPAKNQNLILERRRGFLKIFLFSWREFLRIFYFNIYGSDGEENHFYFSRNPPEKTTLGPFSGSGRKNFKILF